MLARKWGSIDMAHKSDPLKGEDSISHFQSQKQNRNSGILCIPKMRIVCALRPPYPWLFQLANRNSGILCILVQ
jgi:hypothetical protein